MSIAEIEAAIAKLPQAQWLEIRRWMDTQTRQMMKAESGSQSERNAPNFLARQKALFGERTLADSQAILDEARAERF